MNTLPYPWQQKKWQLLTKLHSKRMLPHALLFAGANGLGKAHFAACFANYLLCQEPLSDHACGHCLHCQQVRVNTHPDFYSIAPQKTGGTINVTQVRDLTEALATTAHRGGYRVIIIESASTMNEAASNALLKTLEEPPEKCLFMLVTCHPSLLSPTILSRCQAITFEIPDKRSVMPWLASKKPEIEAATWQLYLAHAAGAPRLALIWAENVLWEQEVEIMSAYLAVLNEKSSPVEIAEAWQKMQEETVLHNCLRVLNELLRQKLVGKVKNNPIRLPISLGTALQSAMAVCQIADLTTKVDSCYQKLQQIYQSTSYNKQLLFEDFLLI